MEGNDIETTYTKYDNYTFYINSNDSYHLNVGSQFSDPTYTNTDGQPNVYRSILGSYIPGIGITNTGLLYTYIKGAQYYLCTYSHEGTDILLWMNLNGNYKFDSSVTIRCPMIAIYYSS